MTHRTIIGLEGPRAASNADETLLQLPHDVWPAAEFRDMSSVHRSAGDAASDESHGVPAVAQGGDCSELHNRAVHEMGSQELLLSRPAQELSDSASTIYRSAPRGSLEIETSAGARKIGIIRAHLEEDAGKMLHDERAGKKRFPRRPQPHRHPAPGNRLEARHRNPRGGESLPRRNATPSCARSASPIARCRKAACAAMPISTSTCRRPTVPSSRRRSLR